MITHTHENAYVWSPSCFHLLTADFVQAGQRLGVVDKMKWPNLPMHWSMLGATNANTSVSTSLIIMTCTNVFSFGGAYGSLRLKNVELKIMQRPLAYYFFHIIW
jgi:hypothetical protein